MIDLLVKFLCKSRKNFFRHVFCLPPLYRQYKGGDFFCFALDDDFHAACPSFLFPFPSAILVPAAGQRRRNPIWKGVYILADTQKLRKLIEHFKYQASPSGSSSNPATVGDINTLISEISKVLNAFVDELEERD